ncbi:MAG: energy transducer TonB [Rudaea sp.]|uniref:energy transducer TonB n=1 Tax=Rudaea sp. TaxID=2136325 RepID=UPI0039E4E1D9
MADAYVDQAMPVSALGLKETAISALKSWQFNPATQNGRPVESEALVPMQFRIEGDATEVSSGRIPPSPTAYPETVHKLEAIVVTGAAS